GAPLRLPGAAPAATAAHPRGPRLDSGGGRGYTPIRMNRVAALVGLALVALGLGTFAWKVFAYDMPVLPRDPEGLWRVELEITARRAGGRGSVRAPPPATGPGREVYDDRSVADPLAFPCRPCGGRDGLA